MTVSVGTTVEERWQAHLALVADLLHYFADLKLSMSQTQVASAMGVPNADALRRLLLVRRLPPFAVIRDWYYLVVMVELAEAQKPIGKWAMARGEYADVYYRFVRRLTGRPWGQVVKDGSPWAKELAITAWAPHMRGQGDQE